MAKLTVKVPIRFSDEAQKDLYETCMAYKELAEIRGSENDRLRELVRVMAYCMQYERECDGCRLNGADGIITAPVGCDGLLDRMHEFGIEVDA